MMKQFANKVAAITGAGSGIGRALAQRLAQTGCHLALADIDGEGLKESARLVAESGVRITTRELDVSDREAVGHWAQQVVSDQGQVNLLFNNAGIARNAPIETGELSVFETVMQINFWGVVYGTRAFLPLLRASGDGHIINISSVYGLIASPYQSAYTSAKFAVRGFTDSLRMELELEEAPVSASCVFPGGVRTNIARSSRMEGDKPVSDDDIARFEVAALTSADEAAAIILDGVGSNARHILVGEDAQEIDRTAREVGADYQEIVMARFRAAREASDNP